MILGLTDRAAAFPEIAQIRKGAPKTDLKKPGPDLDYFRFVTPDQSLASVFASEFGNQPQEIRFISPFNTTSEVFEAWREAYTASSLQHRCDGRMTVRTLTPNGYTDNPMPCPGGCKQVGRLKIVIPTLKRLGFVTVHTTSIWDILTIYQNLMALEMLRGSLRGIPLVLRRVKRAISTPNGNGQRARREKWLLTIEAAPDWVALELDAMQRAALPSANEPLLLTAGDSLKPEIDDENDDESEQLCTPEIATAIETLWTQYGVTKGGVLMALPDYLKSQKGVESLSYLPEESAQKLLAWLQDRALKAQHPEPPKAEPGAGLDQWECKDRALAVDIIQLTEDLEKLGIDETTWRAELAVTNGKPDDTRLSRKDLTFVEATAWRDTLKAWIISKS